MDDETTNPARQWIKQHKASAQIKDALDAWDEVAGLLGSAVAVPATTWTVLPLPPGFASRISVEEWRQRAGDNPLRDGTAEAT